MADFNDAFDKLMKVEGGYSFRKEDAGGETQFGIIKKTARSFGYTGLMKNLDIVTAKGIYYTGWWDKMNLDRVEDQDIAYKIFDMAVNMGVGTAVKYLQRTLNVLNRYESDWPDINVDGALGSVTASMINKAARKRKINILKGLNTK